MKAYPVSTELRDAIERLFDDPSIAFTALGTDLQDSQQFSVSGSDRSISPAKRAKMLSTRLEEFIQQMAEEHEELQSPEATDTFRMQAIGLFIALRELWLHFPELE